jgi:hypothetical protein
VQTRDPQPESRHSLALRLCLIPSCSTTTPSSEKTQKIAALIGVRSARPARCSRRGGPTAVPRAAQSQLSQLGRVLSTQPPRRFHKPQFRDLTPPAGLVLTSRTKSHLVSELLLAPSTKLPSFSPPSLSKLDEVDWIFSICMVASINWP